MNDLIHEIQKLIDADCIQKYPQIRYCITSTDEHIKSSLKQHFQSSPTSHFYTEILISVLPLKITITNSKMYMSGKYSKMSRVLSQTPFKHAPYALSDFVIYFKKHYDADNVNFIGCGREDVDVMCYERPFLLEIVNPKNNLNNHVVDVKFHMGVKICDLILVTKKYRNIFVNAKCVKIYKVEVMSNFYTNKIKKGLCYLKQKTPIRVLHRRANLVRERCIEILDLVDRVQTLDIIIRADAGTYIKEFVSGDFGRTVPSLTEINGHYCICLNLDVIAIESGEIEKEEILGYISINIID